MNMQTSAVAANDANVQSSTDVKNTRRGAQAFDAGDASPRGRNQGPSPSPPMARKAKPSTPQEKSRRFSELATKRARHAIRFIRGLAVIATGYTLYTREQLDHIRDTLQAELDTTYKVMLQRLERTDKDKAGGIDFRV